MVDDEFYETEEVELGGNPKKIVEEAFDGSIPTVFDGHEEIEYEKYDHGGVKIQTDHPEKSDRKFWRGIQNASRGGDRLWKPYKNYTADASKIRKKWFEVLEVAQVNKRRTSIGEAIEENGYESFEHFIHSVKDRIIAGGSSNTDKARKMLNEVLRSYDGDVEVRTSEFLDNFNDT